MNKKEIDLQGPADHTDVTKPKWLDSAKIWISSSIGALTSIQVVLRLFFGISIIKDNLFEKGVLILLVIIAFLLVILASTILYTTNKSKNK